MIAKRPGRRRDGKSSFRALANYILDTRGHGAKVERVRLTNCQSDDLDLALKEISATQALNTRTRKGKTYHLVVSFPGGERPGEDQLEAIEDQLCEAIGLGPHQRLSALHVDTAHLHLHVAISKIHPETLRAVDPYRDFPKLYETCRRLEQAYGLQPLQLDPTRRQATGTDRAAAMEHQSGLTTFQSWVKGEPAAALKACLSQSDVRWADLHRALARYHLVLRPRGAGMVLADRERNLFVKASAVSRELSKPRLEACLGPFVAPENTAKALQSEQHYQKAPVHRHPDREALWQMYQSEQNRMRQSRQQCLDDLRQGRQVRRQAMREAFAKRRVLVQQQPKGRPGKRTLYARLKVERLAAEDALQAEMHQRRQAIRAQHPARSWHDFLVNQAEGGSDIALAILRSRPKRSEREADSNTITGPEPFWVHPLFRQVCFRVDRWGTVTYTLHDGSQIRDEGHRLRLGEVPDASVAAALHMAQLKFGTTLQISGSETFKRQVVKMAAAHQMRVTFTDAVLETERQRATSPGQRKPPRHESVRQDRGLER